MSRRRRKKKKNNDKKEEENYDIEEKEKEKFVQKKRRKKKTIKKTSTSKKKKSRIKIKRNIRKKKVYDDDDDDDDDDDENKPIIECKGIFDIDYSLYGYYISIGKDRNDYFDEYGHGIMMRLWTDNGQNLVGDFSDFDLDEFEEENKDFALPLNDDTISKHEILTNCMNNKYFYHNKNEYQHILRDKCENIKKCLSVKNICMALHFQSEANNDNKLIYEYLTNFYKNLENDFHHILVKHLNEKIKVENDKNFKIIHDIISKKINCSIHDNGACDQFTRNNRNRDNEKVDGEYNYYVDLLDNIHIYFLHSFEMGFRIQDNVVNDDDIFVSTDNVNLDLDLDANEIQQIYIDNALKKIKKYVSSKREKLDISRIQQSNKFITKVDNENNDEKGDETDDENENEQPSLDLVLSLLKNCENDGNNYNEFVSFLTNNEYDTESIFYDTMDIDDNDDKLKEESNIYKFLKQQYPIKSITEIKTIMNNHIYIENAGNDEMTPQYAFGDRYWYWQWFKNQDEFQDFYIKSKYANFKEELLNYFSLTQYQEILGTATKSLNKSSHLKQLKARFEATQEWLMKYYEIACFSPIKISHIMSILCYTNYTQISYEFSKSFRPSYTTETIQSLRKRNGGYFHWSKNLRETIELYGEYIQYDTVFYHGVSMIYFDKFDTRFCIPTSTTKQISVAINFSGNGEGIILELEKSMSNVNYLKYFNASLLSCYGNEDERIFIGGAVTLQFKTIRLLTNNQNLLYFIESMRYFDQCTSYAFDIEPPKKVHYKIIDELIKQHLDDKYKNVYPTYINECFSRFCNGKKEIQIENKFGLNSSFPGFMKHLMFDATDGDYGGGLLLHNNIVKIFPNATKIYNREGYSDISQKYIDSLLDIVKEISSNKKTKLKTIVIARYFGNEWPSSLDMKKTSFLSINWETKWNQPDEFDKELILTLIR